MLKCKICFRDFETLSGLSRHLRYTHKMKLQVYKETCDTSLLPDTSNYELTCAICGVKKKHNLGLHLKNIHNLTSEEYLRLYPNSKIISDSQKDVLCARNKSEEMKQITIARNKSDKMRAIISNRNKDPEFIAKCKAGVHNNPKLLQERSNRMKEINKRNWKNPECRKRMTQAIKKNQSYIMNTPERKKKQRDAMNAYFRDNPEFVAKFINAPIANWKSAKKCEYYSDKFKLNIKCKSQGELDFIKLCESLNTVTHLEYETLQIVKDNGGVYRPDFIICCNNTTYVVEVKFSEPYEKYLDKILPTIKYCEEHSMKFCYMRRFPDIDKFIENGNTFEDFVLSCCKIGRIAGNSQK